MLSANVASQRTSLVQITLLLSLGPADIFASKYTDVSASIMT